ncbi:hypothetical protein ACV242_003062 [Peribacillus simplex]
MPSVKKRTNLKVGLIKKVMAVKEFLKQIVQEATISFEFIQGRIKSI